MNIVFAIIIFSLIILFHELGHFLLAKANHIRVNEFTLGLGPTLAGFTKGETKYCIKLLPFGGSCVMDEDVEADAADDRAFNNKSVWARLSVVAAGPVFNFIMAFLLALVIILIMGYDEPRITYVEEKGAAAAAGLMEEDRVLRLNGSKVHLSRDISFVQSVYPSEPMKFVIAREENGKTVEKEILVVPEKQQFYQIGMYITENSRKIDSFTDVSPAREAGLKSGDEILAINGESVGSDQDIIQKIRGSKGSKLNVTVQRDGAELEISVTPEEVTSYSHGFASDNSASRVKGGFFRALQYSAYELRYWIKTTVQSLRMLLTGQISFKNVSGPVGIVSVIGDTYNQSKKDGALYVFVNMLNLAILLSANLGVMNLLPIPALDGGRILFFLLEIITRRRLPQKVEGMINMIGFSLLMLLMVVVLGHDIYRLFM